MNKKIVIAEDDPNILLSLDFLLRKSGYEVFLAENGAEAIRLIEEHLPNAVLLDVMMPELDGLEVCDYIKRKKEICHIPVIFLTAKGRQEDIDAGMRAGASAYFTKPFSTRDLIETLNLIA